MVDFQSRDTRRGTSDDSEEETENGDSETTDAASAETAEEPEATGEAAATDRSTDESPSKAGFAVVSVGTDRSVDRDETGEAVIAEIDDADGHVATREVLDASYDGVQRAIKDLTDREDVFAVVTAGGTGVEPDDVTVDAVEPMLDRELPGFGELLRILCYDDEGATVIRTRATAGTIDGVPVYCLPGEPALAARGARELVLPEAELIAELSGPETPK